MTLYLSVIFCRAVPAIHEFLEMPSSPMNYFSSCRPTKEILAWNIRNISDTPTPFVISSAKMGFEPGVEDLWWNTLLLGLMPPFLITAIWESNWNQMFQIQTWFAYSKSSILVPLLSSICSSCVIITLCYKKFPPSVDPRK